MTDVLIVEDSPVIRKVLVNILSNTSDIRVIGEAATGREAVEMALKLAPDLITMDIVMPDMDGLEATRQIMATNPRPILIITGHANSQDLNIAFEAIRAGALDIMDKPSGMKDSASEWGKELTAKIRSLATLKNSVRDQKMKEKPNEL
jgi:two-component system chemotaxis response regulator CheB